MIVNDDSVSEVSSFLTTLVIIYYSNRFIIQETGVAFTTLHFLRNLQTCPISWSFCPWQAFPASGNVILELIGPIHKL